MKYKVLETPWLMATSVLSSIVAGVDAISSPFGMAPFWADIVGLSVLLTALCHWVFYIRSSARRAAIREPFVDRRKAWRSGLGIALRSSFYVPIVLGALLLWTSLPLAHHLSEWQKWHLCVTLLGKCRVGHCVKLLDIRKRALGECREFTDESGYLQDSEQRFSDYRPVYAIDCDATAAPIVKLPPTVFDGNCDTVVRLQ